MAVISLGGDALNVGAGPGRWERLFVVFSAFVLVGVILCFPSGESKAKANLERSLKGAHLGSAMVTFEHDRNWQEVSGFDKMASETNLAGARTFKNTARGASSLWCTFVSGKCIRIRMVEPIAQSKSYIKEYFTKYGQADSVFGEQFTWEDGKTRLEVTISSRVTIILSDET